MRDKHDERFDGRTTETGARFDEGGLRAPPGLTGWRKAWWWFDFIVLVKLARLRFVAVLLAIGLVITQWDTLLAYYDRWTRPANPDVVSGDIEYFCPMHPTVIRATNKEKCPICFMPLSKRKKGERSDEVLPAGVVSRMQLTPYRVLLAGIQTYEVDYQPLSKIISAVGYVEFNERDQRTVSARVDGRIDKLLVNETGRLVDVGDDLAHFYSPDLNVTVQNLLDAKRAGSADLLESAKQRLLLLGIDEAQIHECLTNGESVTHVRIRSPISGHVIQKYVREGQYVKEGDPLYDVADISTVWVEAQVYEDDIAALPLASLHKKQQLAGGVKVTVEARAFPGQAFEGQVTFIYPHVDQNTRTMTVRCEVPNDEERHLLPGITATVNLEIEPRTIAALEKAVAADSHARGMLEQGRVLAVPAFSVIETGEQTIVYRQALPGVFEGALVTLGPRMAGPDGVAFYPVLAGLARGDLVVTSGSFLVDAETRLNPAAGSIYFGGSGGGSTERSVTTVRPSTPDDEQSKIAAAMAKLSAADRALAEAQGTCPVLDESPLGAMGVPVKVTVDGQDVFVCCQSCVKSATKEPEKTLRRVAELKGQGEKARSAPDATPPPAAPAGDPEVEEINAALARLSPADRKVAEAQKECPINAGSLLGSMGVPVKLMVEGETVFVCCEGCQEDALADPRGTLEKVKRLRSLNASERRP
jgi:multidrug efflux pump subunit AcrA (membrane-fusion protein)